jgi:hypothetical protein
MGKRVSIVFEEGDAVTDGVSFRVFLEGMTQERREAIDRLTPEQQLQELSTAEFWALRCFQITMGSMVKAGAVREVKKR